MTSFAYCTQTRHFTRSLMIILTKCRLIDPLDGTINFVARIPFCAVSIGFAIKKEIVVGVIYNPIINEMFYGTFVYYKEFTLCSF
jgi:hypothetical protein